MDATLFDPRSTALVAIDLQTGIVGLPVTPHASADVVQRTASIAARLREAGGVVVFVTVGNAADNGDVLAPVLDAPPAPPAARPENWSELAPALKPEPHDLKIMKRQWGAFYGTDLDLQLRRRGISTIILTGIATNIGVESTARSAFEHGYNQIFVEDAMSAMGDGHAVSVKTIFPRIGRLRSTDQVLAAFG